MKNLVLRLWSDEAGFVVSSELVLVATILVLGVIVGLQSVRDAVVQELGDLAIAVGNVNQSYSFSAVTGHNSSTAGSSFADLTDDCEEIDDTAANPPGCISVTDAATDEGT